MARLTSMSSSSGQTFGKHINQRWSDKLRVGRIVQRPQSAILNHIFQSCNDTDFRISNGAIKVKNKLAI